MNRFESFLRGRYGADAITVLTLIADAALTVLVLWFDLWYFTPIPFLLCVRAIYRMLSKNIPARQAERERLSMLFEPYRQMKRAREEQKEAVARARAERAAQAARAAQEARVRTPAPAPEEYLCFACPYCKKKLRLPRGKGNVIVTCPACRKSYPKTT